MSTEDGSNKNNIDGNGTDKNSIDKEKTQEFLHKNGRYLIMAGMLVVILIGIVMLVNNKGTSSADPKARAEKVLKEDYQVDENEAVTKLMKNYYKYYAEGNVDKMKEIATPISKLEQSYIKMFSERVEKYKNIKCYTKEGLDKDSYIVSVTMDMKFPKIKTTIPSLETFYVRTDDKGNLYIDNLYSTFNYIATNEKDVDSSVSEFIDKYEEQDDFVKLANDIEKKSSKAIKSDKDLEKYVNKLNDKVIPKWLNNYKKAQEEEQKKKEEEQKKKDEEKKKQEEEQKKKEIKNHWNPITSEKYFFTYSDGDVDSVIWTENKADKGRYGLRNVFRTKEDAEFEVERRKIMAELQNYADEHNGEIAHPSYAFWLALDEDDMSITVENDSFLPPVGTVLFSNGDIAYDAIETIGEDRILKYMFRVNPNKELHCNGDCECCDEYDPWDEEDED